MKIELQELSLYNLLGFSRPEHHEGIRILWADPKVQYLVLFAGANEAEKAILTVGPDLDYTTIDDILEVEVDGMRPYGFVKSRHFARFDSPRKKLLERLSGAGRKMTENPFEGLFGVGRTIPDEAAIAHQPETDAGEPDEFTRAVMAERQVDEDAVDYDSMDIMDGGSMDRRPSKVGEPSPSALEKATTDEAWAQIKQREEELENLRQELLAREGFITESENRLLEISQQHHERSEELNHKLESLKKWEMQLSERERRIAKLEASTAS